MRTNLLETYGRQLRVAEAYVAKNFEGKQVSNNTKLTTAVLLDNTNRWMTESINESVATMRGDLGAWKKFCLNLTNIAVPSLIANDLVIVHPMTSYSGSVAYLKYVSRTDKGGIKVDDEFNSVFGLGAMNESRINFTSQAIVEAVEEAGDVVLAWTPVIEGAFIDDEKNAHTVKFIAEDGTVSYLEPVDGKVAAPGKGKIAYKYNQEYIPAVDLPTIGPKMVQIPLVAQPRRIAVKYDQITAFQAKTDYGFSLDKQIAEQACGELAYEIDSEIVDMLYKGAVEQGDNLEWSKTLPVGVSKFEHYNGFLEVVEQAKAIVYKRTRKFHPNYMVIGADVLPILKFVNGFTAVKNAKMNGPYKVGDLDGMGIYVSPAIGDREFFFGLNGSDMMSSAGVYAPYMAIVPTQLLGLPDGTLAQGFSTWYAAALLNKCLLVKGTILD